MAKIRVRHGDHEIELDGNDGFIKKRLEEFYARIKGSIAEHATTPPRAERIYESSTQKARPKHLTPAEFYKSKGKDDGVSQILIFAKYLEEHENQSEFSRKDINKVAKSAKLSKDVHTQYFTNAVKQGLLRSLGHGKYALTLSAEEVLASM